jgi:hypothetical protein
VQSTADVSQTFTSDQALQLIHERQEGVLSWWDAGLVGSKREVRWLSCAACTAAE